MPVIKPSSPVINWGNPITNQLRFDIPMVERVIRPRDIVNNYIGSPTGSNITIGRGPLGSSVSFDGTAANYIDFTEQTAYIVTGSAMTMECWAIINDTVGGQFFSKGHAVGTHSSPFFSYAIQTTNLGGRVWVSTSGNPGGVSTSEVSMTVGLLYHVIGTYDGTNINFYLNGVLKAQNGATGTLTNFSGVPLKITSNGGNSGEVINGKLFNARMWSRCLTRNEILSLYTYPWQIYHRFSQPVVNTIAASSGNQVTRMMLGMGM